MDSRRLDACEHACAIFKVLMPDPSGFTLIEVVLVMALSSLLLMAVFAGQSQLRSQAQFDADIDKVVASIDYARNQASSGVNLTGNGDGMSGCAGAQGQTIFAGTVWQISNSFLPNAMTEVKYYKANPGVGGAGIAACVFQSQLISVPFSDISLSNSSPSSQGLIYAKTPTGGTIACNLSDASDTSLEVLETFETGACAGGATDLDPSGTVTLNLTNSWQQTGAIQIDASGLAKRIN